MIFPALPAPYPRRSTLKGTSQEDINNAGVFHGFLLSGGHFSTIDFPGATFTSANAINQRGDIIGRYIVDGVTRGYVLVGFGPACVIAVSARKVAVTSSGAAVTHGTDFTLVTAAKPAAAGEVLSVFATGLGATRPAFGPGQPFPVSPLAPVDSLVEVRVNGRSAIVLGAVGFPGAVDGYQVNFPLPSDTVKGMAALELSAGGAARAGQHHGPVTLPNAAVQNASSRSGNTGAGAFACQRLHPHKHKRPTSFRA